MIFFLEIAYFYPLSNFSTIPILFQLGCRWECGQYWCYCTRCYNCSGSDVFEGNLQLEISLVIFSIPLGFHNIVNPWLEQTESELIVSRLSIPQTKFELQYIRPDFILLRVIARNLIMWTRYSFSLWWDEMKIVISYNFFTN